jgi:hypothetical protein
MFAPPIAKEKTTMPALSTGMPAISSRGAPGSASPPRILQAELSVGAVNDPLEHEADRIADQVMRTTGQDDPVASASTQLSRNNRKWQRCRLPSNASW